VVIDPTVIQTVDQSTVRSFSNQGGSSTSVLEAGGGTTSGGVTPVWRAAVKVPLPTTISDPSSWHLFSAEFYINDETHCTCDPQITVYGESAQPTNYASVVSDAAQTIFTFPDNATNGCVNNNCTSDATSFVAQNDQSGSLWFGITSNKTAANTLETFHAVAVDYYFDKAPPPTSVSSPVNGATVPTTTPTIQANVTDCISSSNCSDPDSLVYYDFTISTAAQCSGSGTGSVVDSGWIPVTSTNPPTTPSWTVPAGSLQDGESYCVSVEDDIGDPWEPQGQAPFVDYVPPAAPTTYNSFTVKLRLGSGGPAPTDTVGSTVGQTSTPSQGSPSPGLPPASMNVNMVNGNLALDVGTHSVQTVSGPA
jgi:hypothetical protein